MFGDPLDKQFSKSLLDAARKINDKTIADAKLAQEDKERLAAEDDSLIGQFDEAKNPKVLGGNMGLHIGSCGLTSFTHYPKKDTVEIKHGGNMGNSVEHNVKPNVDERFGKGTFDKLASKATKVSGSPDYAWSMHVPASHFAKVTGVPLQAELKLESKALDQAVKDVEALGARQRAAREAAEKDPDYFKKKLEAAKAAKAAKAAVKTDESVTLASLAMIGGSIGAGAYLGGLVNRIRKGMKKDPAAEYAKNVAKGKVEAEKTRLRSNRILAMRTGPRNSKR
jgi:hypothetical protein